MGMAIFETLEGVRVAVNRELVTAVTDEGYTPTDDDKIQTSRIYFTGGQYDFVTVKGALEEVLQSLYMVILD